MEEQRNRWTWDLPLFEPGSSLEWGDQKQQPPVRNPPLSSSLVLRTEFERQSVSEKFHKLQDQVKHARQDFLELRQGANDLIEYSNAKLSRVLRYLGVLADRTQKLDQVAIEAESRIAPLLDEKKRLFNELLTNKGNIRVFCRVRPLFEDEGPSAVGLPDEFTVCIDTGDDSVTNSKKDYEFDRVYGPHIGQGVFFNDVQPYAQSAIDGYNVSIFAFGQSNSGKTHTMEGTSQERGLYQRSFEELFDLSNMDMTSICQYKFKITAFNLYNEQVRDLLVNSKSSTTTTIQMGIQDSLVELVLEDVNNPVEFSQVLKAVHMNREANFLKANVSHLVVTIHIFYTNLITREHAYSKLSLVDLPGSECLLVEDASGDQVTDFLHVSKSLSALGDVLWSLTSKKETVPFGNSRLTKILADSIGNSSKALLIAHVCPTTSNIARTLCTLNFSARARNAELSLGNRDTIKKWKDEANDSRKKLYEKDKEVQLVKRQHFELKVALKDANDQCMLLFNEIQKAWKVSFMLQTDIKSKNAILADELKFGENQNIQLRNQVASLLQLDHEQKMRIHEQNINIQNLQDKIKGIESQLKDTLCSSDLQSAECISASSFSSSKMVQDSVNSGSIIEMLEEEISKRDALIENLNQENEKLFDRLSENSSLGESPQVSSSFKRLASSQTRNTSRSESTKEYSIDVPGSLEDKMKMMGALVKFDKPKTPAGTYLNAALMDFDPDLFESFEIIVDGANKLLMLVLAAVIKAGAAREHEILAEIRDAVFAFIRKMEPMRVMDTMLVSRVRILYMRSLIARSPELQSIKVSSVERFLGRANSGQCKTSSQGNSPVRSPVHHDSGGRSIFLIEEHAQKFEVKLSQEKKSKFSWILLKLRGIDEETLKQQITGVKLRKITEEAKVFAIGFKALAALFVHTPAGELQRQIGFWLTENFEFLPVTSSDSLEGTTAELELLSMAIMDGWMAGLGAAQLPHTDAFGLLLSEYTHRVYVSQLQHLKDIAGTLAMEAAENLAHVNKLRLALESVEHKRFKIIQQMRNDTALISKEGGSPIHKLSAEIEDARLASLIALDEILIQVKDIMEQASAGSLTKFKKEALLTSLNNLSARMTSLLKIDQPCAEKHIFDARREIEDSILQSKSKEANSGDDERLVAEWRALQFNTGSASPLIVKCGKNSRHELVMKGEGREMARVLPRPSALSQMSSEEIKGCFEQLPEAVSVLALSRTADATRAKYSKLFETLAIKVDELHNPGILN